MNRRQWHESRAAARTIPRASRARASRRAYTLVELLVVMAIGALLIGISIPGFIRIVGSGSDDVRNGSRELFTVLRAARVYASTHRVPCAVAYSTQTAMEDSATGACVRQADLYVMARGFTDNELDGYGLTRDDRYVAFTPIDDYAGGFKALPGDAAMENLEFPLDSGACEPGLGFFSPPPAYLAERGMVLIRIEDVAGGALDPVVHEAKLATSPDPGELTEYPAHVFLPSGEMLVSDAAQERFQLAVGRRADVELTKRFVNPEGPYNDPANRMAPAVIHLYRGTGRVTMTQ